MSQLRLSSRAEIAKAIDRATKAIELSRRNGFRAVDSKERHCQKLTNREKCREMLKSAFDGMKRVLKGTLGEAENSTSRARMHAFTNETLRLPGELCEKIFNTYFMGGDDYEEAVKWAREEQSCVNTYLSKTGLVKDKEKMVFAILRESEALFYGERLQKAAECLDRGQSHHAFSYCQYLGSK